ncbi:MAG: helix-turn-helix transcriptional regulator [Euryarchaeota archaeon]|nr:helix-turn-helix transcriptional regulator [Euryarchaeota archaeon]MDE1837494.1 helix-turn-helix transcriptional regulator [Euryarchaeota archaeon]MDE2045540.1 helix-turn-helix transcriptional regulator [Thermoplasmata archaeon]
MAFLGKPYVLDILRIFSEEPGPHRFLDLQRRLELSPNTLTSRLRDLVGAGFLTRTAYAEIPPRVDYQGTAKTAQLEEIFEQLGEWARRNDLRPMPVAARSRRVRGLGQVAR